MSSEEDVELYVEFINLVARMILGILTGKISGYVNLFLTCFDLENFCYIIIFDKGYIFKLQKHK